MDGVGTGVRSGSWPRMMFMRVQAAPVGNAQNSLHMMDKKKAYEFTAAFSNQTSSGSPS
jgi:hypothetical protein